jgi:hypothetical protein
MSIAASCIAMPLLLDEPANPAFEPFVSELSPPTEVVPLAAEVPGRSEALVLRVPAVSVLAELVLAVSDELLVSSDDEVPLREPVVPEVPAPLCVPATCCNC